MGTKRVGWARIRSLINENQNQITAPRLKVDNTTLNTGADVTTTLTAAQGGTHFNIDGTDDIVVNMPALSAGNVGLHYSFLVTTAVGGGKTVTFVHPAGGDWVGQIFLYGGASYPTSDAAGDTITLIAATAANARVSMMCAFDTGAFSVWQCTISASEIATIAD